MFKTLCVIAVISVSANAFVMVTPEELTKIRNYLSQWNDTLQAENKFALLAVQYLSEDLPKNNDCTEQLKVKFIQDGELIASQNYIAFAKICEAEMAEIDDKSIMNKPAELNRLKNVYVSKDGCILGMNKALEKATKKLSDVSLKFINDVKNC